MDWATIKNALVAAVQSATGLTDVTWQGEAHGWMEPVRAELVLRSPVAQGVDQYRREWTGTELEYFLEGPRRFTLSVRIESDSQNPGESAPGHYAGLLRTRLRRPSVLAALRVAGVALSRIEATTDVDFTADGRDVSLAQTDVLFLAAETDQDTTADGSDYIETVQIESDTLNDPGGTPLDDQVSEEIP